MSIIVEKVSLEKNIILVHIIVLLESLPLWNEYQDIVMPSVDYYETDTEGENYLQKEISYWDRREYNDLIIVLLESLPLWHEKTSIKIFSYWDQREYNDLIIVLLESLPLWHEKNNSYWDRREYNDL
ncbi:hypothetical protein ACJX0J_038069, partial [Zea mays]